MQHGTMTERHVAAIGSLLIALGPVSLALYTPAMPELVTAFATTYPAVKATLAAYFAGFALAQLICGPLSDAYGRRPVALAFLALGLFTGRLFGAFRDGGLSGYTIGALVLESTLTVLSVRFLQRPTSTT